MDLLKIIENRYSLRDYSDKKIEKEKLDAILNAFRAAPSAKNLQPCKVIAVTEEKSLEKLRGAAKNAFNAPAVLVICVSREDAWERKDGWSSAETDAAIACDHMMLMAASLDIGSVWVCAFNKEKVREALDIDEKYTPISLLPLGYPGENGAPAEWHYCRKELSDIVDYM